MSWRLLSAAEQVAANLREQMIRGGLRGEMPGAKGLAAELGVNHKTMEAALRQLEEEGFLVPQGTGRRRRIKVPGGKPRPALRVAILVNERSDRRVDYMAELQRQLEDAGHHVISPPHDMVELGMDPRRIGRMVRRIEVDGWVVCAGSREVLEWFSARRLPAFALFGRMRGLPLPGAAPDKAAVMATVTRHLVELGHRRIVLQVRQRRRLPTPGATERAFLAALESHRIPSSDYHLPCWDETLEGFHQNLESLFRVTPPTALIVDEALLFAAAQQFLARQGLRVPEDVSLLCTDADPTFDWFRPSVAHIRWDSRPVLRRIMRWADHLADGKPYLRQTFTPAEFVHGGTIGPVFKA